MRISWNVLLHPLYRWNLQRKLKRDNSIDAMLSLSLDDILLLGDSRKLRKSAKEVAKRFPPDFDFTPRELSDSEIQAQSQEWAEEELEFCPHCMSRRHDGKCTTMS